MSQLVTDYEKWMRSWGASERTVEARTRLARARLKAWGSPDGFTPERITEFLGRPEIKQWTRSTYHGHLTSLCDWLVATGHLDTSPMADLRKPRRPRPNPRPLTEPEVRRVMSVVDGRVRDWLLLALLAGLRVSEIAKIRGEDISPDGIYVLGKGDKPEMLPCHDDLWEVAQRYPRNGYWFPGPDNGHIRSQRISVTVSQLFHSLGIEGSIHRMRHVYGTRLLRLGVNIRTVQKLMRHANLETTATYTAVDEDEKRDAINLLSA